jgi:ribose transport system ATP-binding protein
MQTIFGYLRAGKGTVKLAGKPWKLGDTHYSVNNGLIYIPEERKEHGIFPMMGVKENVSMPMLSKLVNYFTVSAKKEKQLVIDVINSYDIKTPTINQKIQYLSGGNQQKAIIGRSMCCKPRVLIFDEPTKGIDVGTKAEIYRIMKMLTEQEGVGIILISSELEEVMKCSNRIITIYNGKKMDEYDAAKTEKSEVINSILGINNKTQRGAV